MTNQHPELEVVELAGRMKTQSIVGIGYRVIADKNEVEVNVFYSRRR
jgi:hypothetical protein